MLLPAQVILCDFVHEDMGVEPALNVVFLDLKEFCKKRSLQLHMQNLTRTLVGYENASQYPTGMLG